MHLPDDESSKGKVRWALDDKTPTANVWGAGENGQRTIFAILRRKSCPESKPLSAKQEG